MIVRLLAPLVLIVGLLAPLVLTGGPLAPAVPPDRQEDLGRLVEARVTIEAGGRPIRVSAQYRFAGLRGPVRFHALRLADHELTLAGAEVLPGMYRLAVDPPAASGGEVRLSYVVMGGGGRVPLFVPTTPAVAAGSSIEIRLRGLAPGTPARGGFPRFSRATAEEWVTRPDNLPAFVWLPSPLGRSLDRAADAGVLLALVVGTVAWLAFRARARRTGCEPAVQDPPSAHASP